MVCPGCQKDVGTKGYCAECTEAFEGLQRDRQTAGGDREREPAQGTVGWECPIGGCEAVEQLQAHGVIRPEGECGREGCSNTEGLLSLVWCAECRQATLGDECAPPPMRPCVECRHCEAGRLHCRAYRDPCNGDIRRCADIRYPLCCADYDYLPCPRFAEKAAADV